MFEKLKEKLVDDVHECYKWFSTYFFIAIPLIVAAQENIPIVAEYLPNWIVAVVSILGFAARVYKQGSVGKGK